MIIQLLFEAIIIVAIFTVLWLGIVRPIIRLFGKNKNK